MTITICNGKGGAGKTTLAVLLVLALRRMGRSAELLDRDPQGTAGRWLEVLGEPSGNGQAPAPDCRVIDTPPLVSGTILADSLREADLVLLVSSASPADLWTSQSTAEVIRTHVRPGKPARLVFNQVQKRTLLGRDLAHLADRIGMPSLSNSLSRRQAYQHAALMGWSALDSDARKEMLALAGEIDMLASTP